MVLFLSSHFMEAKEEYDYENPRSMWKIKLPASHRKRRDR